MQFVVFGVVLVIWIAILAAILLNPKGKLPGIGEAKVVDVLLPMGVALAVWLWIFALVISSG